MVWDGNLNGIPSAWWQWNVGLWSVLAHSFKSVCRLTIVNTNQLHLQQNHMDSVWRSGVPISSQGWILEQCCLLNTREGENSSQTTSSPAQHTTCYPLQLLSLAMNHSSRGLPIVAVSFWLRLTDNDICAQRKDSAPMTTMQRTDQFSLLETCPRLLSKDGFQTQYNMTWSYEVNMNSIYPFQRNYSSHEIVQLKKIASNCLRPDQVTNSSMFECVWITWSTWQRLELQNLETKYNHHFRAKYQVVAKSGLHEKNLKQLFWQRSVANQIDHYRKAIWVKENSWNLEPIRTGAQGTIILQQWSGCDVWFVSGECVGSEYQKVTSF